MEDGKQAGFSQIELLMVLAIMSLSAVVVFQGFNFRGLRQSNSEIVLKIANIARMASLRAISRATDISLVIDVKDRVISLDGDESKFVIPEGFTLKVTTGAELKSEYHKAVVDFSPDGTASGGRIEVLDSFGHSSSVSISWLTGAITVDDGK